jgi:hypothetical protein
LSISDQRAAQYRRLLALTLSAACTALVAACSAGPVEVAAVSPSPDDENRCRDLIDALPSTVAGQSRRDVEPSDAPAAAWGDPAIVVRCGVPRPATFKATSQCWEIDHVPWFATDGDGRPLPDSGPIEDDVVFTTIGRSPSVEVTVPDEWTPQSDALFDLADAIKASTSRLHGCA